MSDTEKKYDVDLSIKLRTGIFGSSDPEVVKVKQRQVTLDQIHEMVLFHVSALEPTPTEGDTNVDSNDQNAEELASEIREEEERDFDCCASENGGIRPGRVIEQHIYGPATKVVVTEEYEYDEEGLLMKKTMTTDGTVGFSG